MKRKVCLILSLLLMILSLEGCGSSDPYHPEEVAQYNTIYRSTSNNELNGQYPVINIANIEKENGDIIISIGAPTEEQIIYAFDNYLYVNLLDEEGNTINFQEIKLKTKNLSSDAECEIWITTVEKLDEVKYIEVGPYKTDNDKKVIFEIEG